MWGGGTLERLESVTAVDRAGWDDGHIRRIEVYPARQMAPAKPLLFIDDPSGEFYSMPGHKIIERHDPRSIPSIAPAAACYFSSRIVVSGNGLLWLDDKVITAGDLMPAYWRERLTGTSTQSRPEVDCLLPVRVIDGPCLCALGWGNGIYGHVLTEMLPRMSLGLAAASPEAPKVLLHSGMSAWLLQMLRTCFAIDADRIEFFDPDQERILLRRGIFPCYLGFHPCLRDLLPSPPPGGARRGTVYVSRLNVSSTTGRTCTNEDRLEAIARDEFGATIAHPERLARADQIKLFNDAAAIVGLYGSALHTSLLSSAGLKMGVVGALNSSQSHIANLRDHRLAYQVAGFRPDQNYIVPEDGFRMVLAALA